jgi:peptide/nickel transport system substrate-binding protein
VTATNTAVTGLRAARLNAARLNAARTKPARTKPARMGTRARRTALAMLALVAAASTGLAACSSGSTPGSNGSGGRAVQGGTAYFAEQPLQPPTYIFPLVSGENFSVENTADFQTLLYPPLYWYGDQGSTSVNYPLSIGNAPVYSDSNRVVTITLKHYAWSDGETVSARDVGFWINLLKANKADWASYVPGGFPDNVVSWQALSPASIQLRLNASYNPLWFTYNELSQITPLPIAWDRTALTQQAPSPTAPNLPDTTAAGAKDVYGFLNGQAEKLSSYASSPIWSVVDGPWKLASLTTDGTATFVPNQSYTGPDQPELARFVELPFTSTTAEFSVLKAGPVRGGPGSSGQQLSVGYVPDNDLPQQPALKAQGYQLVKDFPFGFDYFEPNFNNPKVGPILRQLYFRQAFQHLVDQTGWIHAYYSGLGVPTYSPVPARPANPYSDARATVNPYPFSVPAARKLLTAHGWKVVPDGVTTCTRPGPGSGECGAGIKAGQPLTFTLMYPAGLPYTDNDLPGRGDRGHDRPDDRALRGIVTRVQLGTRQLRQRVGLRARSLSERRGDLPDRRARQREQLLRPGRRPADHRDHDDLRGRGPGGARRLRRPGPAGPAGLLAAEPGHPGHGPGQPARLRAERVRLHQPPGVALHQELTRQPS